MPFDRRGDFIAGVDLNTRDVEQRSVPWGSGHRGEREAPNNARC